MNPDRDRPDPTSAPVAPRPRLEAGFDERTGRPMAAALSHFCHAARVVSSDGAPGSAAAPEAWTDLAHSLDVLSRLITGQLGRHRVHVPDRASYRAAAEVVATEERRLNAKPTDSDAARACRRKMEAIQRILRALHQ